MLIAGFPTGSMAANCYLIAAGPGSPCLVIDPGENALDAVRAAITEHELTPVGALLTHGHFDHAASLRTIADAFDVPGYLHPADEYMLDDPLAALSTELRTMLAGYPMPAMRPDELRGLTAGQRLEFPGFELLVRHTPGHTGGSVVFQLDADEASGRPEVLFTGDTLFAGSVGRTDLPGGSTATLDASLRDSLLTRPDSAVVLPGHGPQSTIGAERASNPFLMRLADYSQPDSQKVTGA